MIVKKLTILNIVILAFLVAISVSSIVISRTIVYEYNQILDKEREVVEKMTSEMQNRNNLVNRIINQKVEMVDRVLDRKTKKAVLINKMQEAIIDFTKNSIDNKIALKIATSIEEQCVSKYNLDPAQVLSQIKQESNFNPKAVSRAGARGLMQIIDKTAAEIAASLKVKRYNIYDIQTNIMFGCYYMADLLQMYNQDLDYALRAYNFGPHNVEKVKRGEKNYAFSVLEEMDGFAVEVLTDKKGNIIYDEEGQMIMVMEEHKYPRETRNYLRNIKKEIQQLDKYYLDLFR